MTTSSSTPAVTEVSCDDDTLLCVTLAEVAVMTDDTSSHALGDLSGDGAADFVAGGHAAYVLPALGEPVGEPFATFASASPMSDYDGDGLADLCAWDGVFLGPVAGVVDGTPDYPDVQCGEDVTGDGIADLALRIAPDGDFVIHAGPLASTASEPWLRVTYRADPADPAYDYCYWMYGFLDWSEVPVIAHSAELLVDAGSELVISTYDWWAGPDGGMNCPLAEPLVLVGGSPGEVEVGPTGTGPLIPSGEDPYPLPDVNGDGVDDFTAGEFTYAGPATLVNGRVDLSFPIGPGPGGIVVPDLDGDGLADLFVEDGDSLTFFSGDGTGGVSAPFLRVETGALRTLDFNRTFDLLVVGVSDGTGFVRLSDLAAVVSR